MLKLSDREWKPFFIAGDSGVFSIRATQSGIDKNKLVSDSVEDIPYITRSGTNNGINMFVSRKQSEKYKIDNGNVITIGLDTQTVFYQPHAFFTGQNIQVLEYPDINCLTALFICSMLKVQLKKFNWGGNGATLGRLYRTKIMLPVDGLGQPDYTFMEQYVSERRAELIRKYSEYNKKMKTTEVGGVRPLTDVNSWKAFDLLGDKMFHLEPQRGFSNTSDIDETGIYDVVGATYRNNGNVGFLPAGNEELVCEGNCICLIKTGQGSVGKAVYKRNRFIPSNNVCIIRSPWLNLYNGLFIVTEINKQAGRYSYGYIRNEKRIAREKLMLPADTKGEPDYRCMEQYGRIIIQQKCQRYFEYQGV